jgi:hypothetical protein
LAVVVVGDPLASAAVVVVLVAYDGSTTYQ